MANLKIGTLNVGGIHSPIKRKKILLYLKKQHIDIAFLQETHLLPPEVVKLGTLGWTVLSSAPFSSKARGVVTLIRNVHNVTVHASTIDHQGRYTITDISIDRTRLLLCNVYAPNVYSKDFFLQLLAKLYTYGDIPLILGGDLNIVASPKMDRSAPRQTASAPKVGVSYLARRLHATDIWRILHPLDRDYTCLSAAHGTLSRIDYLLTSETLFPRIIESAIETICISDHALCWVRIARNVDRGSHKQWRFPSYIAHSVKFREAVQAAWLSYSADNAEHASNSPLLFWQASKAVLRGQILSYTAHREKTLHASYATLQENLTLAYTTFKDSPSPGNRESYISHKEAFMALLSQMEAKHTFSARSTFHRFGNRSGKLLSRLLKGQHPPTIIKCLRNAGGAPTTKGTEMSAILQAFYEKLYKCAQSDEVARVQFWEKVTLPQMTSTQAASLMAPITPDEIRKAIKHLKTNKSPGPDGLSNEFYKILAPYLVDTLCAVFNSLLDGQTLPAYFNSALIKVLHKQGRDPELPASYRPISLLNSDYKLFTKIVADRLKSIVPSIIHEDQTGFIPGRQSVTNVRKVLSTIQWVDHQGLGDPCAILSLDAEKAFDLVAWDHLFDTLLKFGAPVEFTHLLRRLYAGSASQILNNGYLSAPFPIQQGTRQGCPLSPLLFALAIEPLAVALRASPDFQGIRVGSHVLKLSMFADDMLLFISDPINSLNSIISTLDQFSSFAGFRVNYSKSNLLPLSSDLTFFKSHASLSTFALCTAPMKYLGVRIPRDLRSLYKTNHTPIIQSISKSLMDWKNLPLSLSGRVAVIKSVLFPKLSYILQMIPMLPSKSDLTMLRRMFASFLWQGKKPRISYSKLILPREKGGFGLPDVLTFSQTLLFRHISDWLLGRSTFSNYHLEESIFSPYSPSALLHLPKSEIPHNILTNVLFNGAYGSWCSISKRLQRNSTESKFTTFWGNPSFPPGLDSAHYRTWREKGIAAVRDVFDPGGSLYSFDQLKAKFAIGNRDFFMYLQMRHFVQSMASLAGDNTKTDAFSETMVWIASRSFKVRFLYPALIDPLVEVAWQNSAKGWASDIPMVSSFKLWLDPCGSALKCLPSAALQETHLKTLHRAYISPSQRKHMVPEESGTCKKCGAADASFFHCMWDCGKVKRFWHKLLGFLSIIFSVKLPRLPVPCLFLNFAEWSLNPHDRRILTLLPIFLTVAKQCILFHWIEKSPPFLHEVKSRILSIIYYERQKAFPDIEKGVIRFYKKWEAYIEKLPQETQLHIQKVFESTTWFHLRQL